MMRVQMLSLSMAALLLLAACGGTSVVSGGAAGGTDDVVVAGWRQLPDSILRPRHGATAVWVDGTLLVFGGRDTDPCPPAADCPFPKEPPRRDGARFDADSRRWSALPPLPVEVEFASTAVLGGTVFAWTHARSGEAWTTAFLSYDLGADRWEQLPLPDGVDLRRYELEAGNGGLLLHIGSHEDGRLPDLRYDPEQRRFAELPPDPLPPSFDRDLTQVGPFTVVTGVPISPSPGGADGPARYRAAAWTDDDGWRELPPGDVIGFSPEWVPVDGELVNPTPGSSRGGQTNAYDRAYPFGGRLDPATGEWSELPDAPDVQPADLRLDGLGDEQLLLGGGLAFQPRAGRWVPLDAPGDVPYQGIAAAVGDGQLYIFGGVDWDDGTQPRLSASTWVFTPPRD